ncbi:conserved hypothetical protein, partial [Ricinus communis]
MAEKGDIGARCARNFKNSPKTFDRTKDPVFRRCRHLGRPHFAGRIVHHHDVGE